jgi:6,7-dimethyl-8-ribityllumazine synthase
MPRTIHGDLDGHGLRFAVVVSKWNVQVTDRLLAGALEELTKAGVLEGDVLVVEVPGAFELPAAAARLAATKRFDGVVALGCLLKGETSHDRVIADACAQGLMDVSVTARMPVTFGVVTADTLEQALERSEPASAGGEKRGHKGKEAAAAAVRLATALADADGAS